MMRLEDPEVYIAMTQAQSYYFEFSKLKITTQKVK